MKYLTAMYISLSESLGIYTLDQLYELFTHKHHSMPISRHRATIIQSRVFFFCAIFAVLVPTWSLIDLLFLPGKLWGELLLIRLLSSAAFILLAWQARKEASLLRARLLLAGMLSVTPLFYLVSDHWLQSYELSGTEQVVAELYALLPFVMIAGLTLFPLTLRELLAYATPMLTVVVIAVIPQAKADIPQAVSTIWLFSLILGVAMFASLNQLRYMLSQVNRASYDVLTGLLTRRAGIEMLDLQFRLTTMSESHLSILYLDLDHFKTVNDVYGHDAGDVVLKTAAQQLCATVRKGDSVIRWGGEEFIVILPTATPDEANDVINRIMVAGLGLRPDNTPVTASIGVAEIQADAAKDWKALIELADHRMYTAKTGGRARSMGINDTQLLWPENSSTETAQSTEILHQQSVVNID
ncbi:diguanylate cyclase (GGDEF) domain-containing protein [Amphritea atlantica]|uniref:diguanylate cyclase n=1 Tax=Amphritea atlantica TaxID=355243 RepID=A0A1H9EI06_9GAMM|nr:GGDEF domain-containing protein [Amphritea atlantica]SEQ25187.1 diguanylate cyclase (GGDEF) domain-containing protein [Amphritea atlantica]